MVVAKLPVWRQHRAVRLRLLLLLLPFPKQYGWLYAGKFLLWLQCHCVLCLLLDAGLCGFQGISCVCAAYIQGNQVRMMEQLGNGLLRGGVP